jgi:adenosylhomocysteine nucleosidase
MNRLLVVAATPAEAAYVPQGLPVVITGIGKTAAAVSTTRALAAEADVNGLTVVNIGTAGALRDGLAGIYEPGAVLNHEVNADVIKALGYDPGERIETAGDAAVVLATGDAFIADSATRDRLAERAHLVDMEGYAVAYAAHAFGVPVRLVKHVSDDADEAALDWPTMVDASARVLGNWLRDHVSSPERS